MKHAPPPVSPLPFDPAGLHTRREAYHHFVRAHVAEVFLPDGSYAPAAEPDGRIAYWILPALISSPDPALQEWARRVYARAAGWQQFDVFMTSGTAANLLRHRAELGPELVKRSEQHLATFALRERGRKPCAAVYDYMAHGYNDNMPCMSMRTLLLAAAALGRADLRDAGLFHLEGLAAHFARRGMLSEHTSPTYTPISLCALLDIAECGGDAEVRGLAQACADRVLLDLVAHYHAGTGTSGNTSSRSYTVDCVQTASNLNAYLWYVLGAPLLLNPIELLSDPQHPSPLHHARNFAFNLAQWCELMNASHAGVRPDLIAYARAPRPVPYEVRATADWSASGPGGAQGYLTRSYQRPAWWLATSATTAQGSCAGQQMVLVGALAAVPQPSTWRDRVAFWHKLIADHPDAGEDVALGASPHAGAFAGRDTSAFRAESDHITDLGWYSTAQAAGTAMLLGSLGPEAEGRTVEHLRFALLFGTLVRQPDEYYDGDQALAAWAGQATPHAWQFLRFGEIYLGLRATGKAKGQPLAIKRVVQHRYLRLEVTLYAGAPKVIDHDFRTWTDFGLVVEMGDASECGSFAAFRQQVQRGTWEFYHAFGRQARFIGRGGELQISDSGTRGTQRFIAVDGRVEDTPQFTATGMDPALVQLFPDGHRVVQRRLFYHDHVSTPFYDQFSQVLAADRTPPSVAG